MSFASGLSRYEAHHERSILPNDEPVEPRRLSRTTWPTAYAFIKSSHQGSKYWNWNCIPVTDRFVLDRAAMRMVLAELDNGP